MEVPITVNIPPSPPAYVQTVDQPGSFTNYQNQQEARRQYEVVVACLVLEAGGEGKIGMEAVNEVLNNRAKQKFGNDAVSSKYAVAIAPKQFSCFNGGTEYAVQAAKKHPNWSTAENIVKAAPTNHTNGARYYYANRGRNAIKPPSWAAVYLKRGAKTVQIGNHLFLYGFKGN
jgi:hypothetical protein